MKIAKAKIVKPTKGIPLTLAALDAMPLQLAGSEWSEAQRWSRAAAMFEKGKLAAQVMAGFALGVLQDKFGETRGKKPNDSVFQNKGTWADLVKEKCGISDDTARNWMAMSKEAGKRLKKLNLNGPVTFRELMELPVDQWTDAQMKLVTSAIAKLTDGKSQIDFMRELGLAKKPAKGRPGGTEVETDGDEDEELTPRQQAERQAQSLFHTLQDALFSAIAPASKKLALHLPLVTDDPEGVASIKQLRTFLKKADDLLGDAEETLTNKGNR